MASKSGKNTLFSYMMDAEDEIIKAGYKVKGRKYSYKYQMAFPKAVYKAMWEEAKKDGSLFYKKGSHLYYNNIYGERIYIRKLKSC